MSNEGLFSQGNENTVASKGQEEGIFKNKDGERVGEGDSRFLKQVFLVLGHLIGNI